jgi:hypothetical protein
MGGGGGVAYLRRFSPVELVFTSCRQGLGGVGQALVFFVLPLRAGVDQL